MRKVLITAGVILVAVAAFVAMSAQADDDQSDSYMIRAIFDTASFVVQDMDVRVGGANVGHVADIDVTRVGEISSARNGGTAVPGKAVVVLAVTEPGFKDFREDASCIIRPQSLIGEKYIDCRPTVPRRTDSEPPPPLELIGDDQPGAGQYLLPFENNGKTVDVDLVNNIMRRPFAERFRIILNELGGTFAGRGEDLKEIVERANPTLREVNRVFKILADQNRSLAQLAADSDEIMRPLARERERVVGFIRNSGEAAEASAEYSTEIRQSWEKFPGFLREFRATMAELGGFAEEAIPVARDLNRAAPSFTVATQALEPFSQASTRALKSLGEAGEEAGPIFAQTMPLARAASTLAISGAQPLFGLSAVLSSTERTGGWQGLMDLIYNTTGVLNGYDSYGHFARTLVVPVNCFNFQFDISFSRDRSCAARFRDNQAQTFSHSEMMAELYRLAEEGYAQMEAEKSSGGVEPDAQGGPGDPDADDPDDESNEESDAVEGPSGAAGPGDETGVEGETGSDGDAGLSGPTGESDASTDLLNYLLGP